MENEQDLFRQINHAVLDLQRSEYQTWERPLKRLAQLLHHPELESFNQELTKDLDIEAFLAASEQTGGGMMGSHKLLWPDDQRESLGLTFMLIEKMADDMQLAMNISHYYFYSGSSIVQGIHTMTSQLIIPFARDYKAYVLNRGNTQVRLVNSGSSEVFIVHGHDEAALQSLARFLEKLGLAAIVLREQPNQGRTIIEKFEACAREVGFAVVLLTPDDLGGAASQSQKSLRGRQNVIFELGYFAGALGRGRVCLLRKGDIEMPSDLYGVIYTDMDPADVGRAGWSRSLRPPSLTSMLIVCGHET